MGARASTTAILCLVSAMAWASDATFKVNEKVALENSLTTAGADYDYALGTTLQSHPRFESGMTACLNQYPGDQSVHGYFEFSGPNAYKVVLEPQSDFSACLAKSLEGFDVPEPPKIPYFNKFSFATTQ